MPQLKRVLLAADLLAPPAPTAADECCGLCGAMDNLTQTPCCGHWICDDEEDYVIFSFARNSCSRNHDRYTLCSYHSNEGHPGDWRTCAACRRDFETEIYVYYGTNEYNFEKLPNPPAYAPTKCNDCGRVLNLGEGGYAITPDRGYLCERCSLREFRGPRRGRRSR